LKEPAGTGAITGATADTLTMSDLAEYDQGQYCCQVSDSETDVTTSSLATLTMVNPLPLAGTAALGLLALASAAVGVLASRRRGKK